MSLSPSPRTYRKKPHTGNHTDTDTDTKHRQPHKSQTQAQTQTRTQTWTQTWTQTSTSPPAAVENRGCFYTAWLRSTTSGVELHGRRSDYPGRSEPSCPIRRAFLSTRRSASACVARPGTIFFFLSSTTSGNGASRTSRFRTLLHSSSLVSSLRRRPAVAILCVFFVFI